MLSSILSAQNQAQLRNLIIEELYTDSQLKMFSFKLPPSQQYQLFQHLFSHPSTTILLAVLSPKPVIKVMHSTKESASIFWCEGVPANLNMEGFGFVINHTFMVEHRLYPNQLNNELVPISVYSMLADCYPALMTLQGWSMSPLKNTVSPKTFIVDFIKRALFPVPPPTRFPSTVAKPSISTRKSNKLSKDQKLVHELETIIEAHLEKHELLNIDKVANGLKINRVTLQKKFKRFHNKTIYEYYLDRKLEQACELLQHYSVQDVSKILGYSQSIKFIIVFKKKYNITPKAYKYNYSKSNSAKK